MGRHPKHELVAEYERQHPSWTLRLRGCGHFEGVPVPPYPDGAGLDYRIEFWFCYSDDDSQPDWGDGLPAARRNDAADICATCAFQGETARLQRSIRDLASQAASHA